MERVKKLTLPIDLGRVLQYNKSTSNKEMECMEIIMKLKRELVDENIVDLFTGVEVSTITNKNWVSLKISYEDTNIYQLSYSLSVLFKEYFKYHDRVGMRINNMPYVATSDNKNVKTIMQKLLK